MEKGSNKTILTDWENIHITKNKDFIINFEVVPTYDLTRMLVLKPVEGSRSDLSKNKNSQQSIMDS